MAKIFISYRRDDTADAAGRLYDRLSAHFGDEPIFMDIDNIPPGEDFVEVIETAVSSCDILLACIGRNWVTSTDASGQRRLHDPLDFVRLEIATALQRKIRVIPILLQGASLPALSELPEELTLLLRRQAIDLSHTRWRFDVDRLIAALEQVIQRLDASTSTPSKTAKPPTIIGSSPEQKAQAEELRKQADTKYNQGKLDQALADFNRALELDPSDATAYNNRGNVYAEQGKPDQAFADYNRALELKPSYAIAYYNRAIVYYDRQQYDQALADYNRALELTPTFANDYNGRGNTYKAQGKLDQALGDYNRALELNSSYAIAYYNRGLAYESRKNISAAQADFKRAFDLGYAPAKNMLK